ncbi:MAG: hypothetical protein H6600_05190 [Flavobacteriales bacterium]|nr:hypothetical protein [Flavobacteriales bacterium]
MDIFNSNRRLEELVMYGIDWGTFLRHDMDGPIAPFMYLKNGNEQYVRMLMTDGDPLEYAKKVLEKEEKPFQQFIIGFEGYLRDNNNERVDSIIVHGFDTRQEKGVSLGQMFSPKESGAFKKIDKVTFLGKPDLILPLKSEENPDFSVEEIGFNAVAISDKENGLTKYLAVFTHDNPSVIANTIKRFLRSKFSSEDSQNISGDFDIQITENCVKNAELLTFLVKNAISDELSESCSKNWSYNYKRNITIQVKYNDKIIFETMPSNGSDIENTESSQTDLSKVSISELDSKFYTILKIPNARTNFEALTKMSELLNEYKRRNIETPDKRTKSAHNTKTIKKWWEFWK